MERLWTILSGCLLCSILCPVPAVAQHHKAASTKTNLAQESPGAQSSAISHFSLDDLEQLALKHNPTLSQAAAQIEVARSKALQAGLYPNPTIGYSGEQIGVNGTPGELQGGFIQQTIVTAGKLRLSRAKYQQQAVEAEILATGQQLRVINGVHTRFYEVLAAQRMVGLKQELLKNARESLLTFREMFNTGLANEADVYLAEIELNRAKIALASQENQYQAQWQSLVSVIGVPELPPTPLIGNLEMGCAPLDWDSSLTRLLHESPIVQAAQAHVVFDQILLKREKVEPIPNVNVVVGGGYNFENPNTVANVQLGIRLPLWNRNQGTIRQAQFELSRSRAEVARLELWMRKQLAMTFNHYKTAWLTAKLYREANIPKAAKAHTLMLDMYKKRRVAWPEVVKLQKNLFDVQSEYTSSLLELRRADVAIKGLLMVDGLTPPPSPLPAGHLEATPTPR